MKRFLWLSLAVCVFTGSVQAKVVHEPDFKSGYSVRPSSIVPRWSGAVPGEWTMDYQTAFAQAADEGRYTLLFFSGMWWCPHCQALEERALVKDAFKAYSADHYLAVVDFPYRNGFSNWCWLWDEDYRVQTGLTPAEVTLELVDRFAYQDSWSLNGALTTNVNVTVEVDAETGATNLVEYALDPQTGYHRVGYPTIIVVRPDGMEAGRFSFNRRITDAQAVDYVIGSIELAKNASGTSIFADPAAGGFEGAAAASYTGWLGEGGSDEVTGLFTVKTGKCNKKSGTAKLTATLALAGGRKVKLSGIGEGHTTNVVFTLVKKGAAEKAIVKIGANGLVGVYTDEAGVSHSMTGGRNVFSAKDSDAKGRASRLVQGFWTCSLRTVDNGGSPFANGSGGFSVNVGKKGKVKLSGTLGDGTKLKAVSQVVMGDGGEYVVPFLVAPYSKKGNVDFVLRFSNGLLGGVVGSRTWVATGKEAFVATYSPGFVQAAGVGTLHRDALRVELEGVSIPDTVVVGEDISYEFIPNGKKWKGCGETTETFSPVEVSLSFAEKTGIFKGTLTISAKTRTGKIKKFKAKTSGVIVNGAGEGTAVFKDVGSWRIRIISTCGGDC